MDIQKLKNLSLQDRRDVLESEAYEITEGEFLRPLSTDELAIIKDELADKSIKRSLIEKEYDEVKAGYKGRLKPLQAEIATAVTVLSTRMKTQQGKVYVIPDMELNTTFFINENGDILNSRPIKPEERTQMRLSSAGSDTHPASLAV